MAQVKRLHYLDSLRGLAALSVVCSHFVLAYGLPASVQFLRSTPVHVFWHGDGAVSLFFVLSGFVLSLPFFVDEKRAKHFTLIPYAIARSFRIIPLFAVVIILGYLAHKYLFIRQITYPVQSGWAMWHWTQPLSIKGIVGLAPQVWTLLIELPVSILVPFITFMVVKNKWWTVFATYLLVITLGLNHFVLDFLIGILIAQNYERFKFIWDSWRTITKFDFISLGLLLYTAEFFLPPSINGITQLAKIDLSGVGSAIVILALLSSQRLQRFLSQKVFVFLGQISYGIYLTHFMILMCFTPWFISFLNSQGFYDQYGVRVLGLLATILLTVMFSTLTYFLVEKPGIQIGRKISRKFSQLIDL